MKTVLILAILLLTAQIFRTQVIEFLANGNPVIMNVTIQPCKPPNQSCKKPADFTGWIIRKINTNGKCINLTRIEK